MKNSQKNKNWLDNKKEHCGKKKKEDFKRRKSENAEIASTLLVRSNKLMNDVFSYAVNLFHEKEQE